MAYPVSDKLAEPVTNYNVEGYRFKQHVKRRWWLWSTHLGDDVIVPVGTTIMAVGAGEVVWAEMRLGSAEKRNWGGIVVVGHTDRKTQKSFYSVYGHISDLTVKVGEVVRLGQPLGLVAKGESPENGWWKIPHLHFGIYTGPWREEILPGYKRIEEWRTMVRWWHNPKEFIASYNT